MVTTVPSGPYAGNTPLQGGTTDHAGVHQAIADAVAELQALMLTPTGIKTSNYPAVPEDLVICDTSGGAFTVTLPSAPVDRAPVGIILVTAGNPLTVNCGGSDVFNKPGGLTSKTLSGANQQLMLMYNFNGGRWYVLDDVELQAANNLADVANAGTSRTNLGLGNMATQSNSAVNITGGAIAGINPPIAVADGGTGANSASAARSNLGLAISTNVQAFNSNLQAISGLSTATDKLSYWTGSATAALTDLSSFARTLLDDTSQGAMRTTLGLVPGTDVQAFDATLAAIASLSTSADKLIYATGSDAFAITDLSSFARTLIDDTSAGAALVTLGADVGGAAAVMAQPSSGVGDTVQRLHRAFANRASSPIKIMFVGDSEFDFAFLNRYTASKLASMFTPQNLQMTSTGLDAAGSTAPGDTSWGIGNASPSVWTSVGAGGMTTANVQNHRGLGGNALKMTDGQAVQSVSCTFDKLTFYWLTPLAGSGATLEFFVDGVSVHTSTSTAAGSYDYDTAASPAAHTIKVLSHGENLFDFVQVHRGNKDAWVKPISAVHTGYNTSDFNSCTDFAGYVASLDPDVVVLETAINDADAATYYADMNTLIDTVQANTTATILLVLPNAVLGRTTWAGWRRNATKLAGEQAILFLDLGNYIPDLSVSDPLGYTGDGVHYKVSGANGTGVASNAITKALFGGIIRDLPMWEAFSTFSSFPGHVRLEDTGGNVQWKWYLKRGDTQPAFTAGSNPSAVQSGLTAGPGGTTAPDVQFIRGGAGRFQLTDALSFGSVALGGVRMATTAALPACTYANGTSGVGSTLTGNSNGALAAIDGVTPVANNRILVRNQASAFQNGVYLVTTLGDGSNPFVLTRSVAFDEATDLTSGALIDVSVGTVNIGTRWNIPGASYTLGTTAITPVLVMSPDAAKRVVTLQVTDPLGAALTTGDGQAYYRVPAVMNNWNLVAVAGHVTTVSSSGIPTVQIANVTDSVDFLSTKLTIDASEKDSSTAATAAVINASNDDVQTGDEIRIDVDVAGTGTKGLMVELTFQMP